MNKGIFYALGAYTLWGFFPIYFKLIKEVSAVQIVGHRIVWSFLFLFLILVLRSEVHQLRSAIKNTRFLLVFLASAVLLAINWLTYVYGVNSGFIIEASLGYFINPLVSVLLGVIILREKLRRAQWISVALAACGVVYLTFNYGRLPWIALLLALSFGLYGLAKKTAPLGSFYGLTLETGLLVIPSIIFLTAVEGSGSGSFGHTGLKTTILLILVGPMTAIPLLLFGSAARQINLSMLGLMQYIAPTLQFIIGVAVYQEPFTPANLIGFILIWIALILLWLDMYLDHKKRLVFAPNTGN